MQRQKLIMGKILKEFGVNVRKIPLSLEVAFWNIVISLLTTFKSIRSYSHISPATTPSLKKSKHDNLNLRFLNSIYTNVNTYHPEIKLALYKVCFWAMLGFVTGFLFGILLGS